MRYLCTVALYFGHKPGDLTFRQAQDLAEMAGFVGIVKGVHKGWGEFLTVEKVFPTFAEWTGEDGPIPQAMDDPDQLPWG